MIERITLRPGDYILTKGLSEDDYHAVARVFMAAGADGRKVSGANGKRCASGDFIYVGWDPEDNQIFHVGFCTPEEADFARNLTVSQVLNATNAGNGSEDDVMPEIGSKCSFDGKPVIVVGRYKDEVVMTDGRSYFSALPASLEPVKTEL